MRKGFTLFTALIGALVIVMAVLLVQSMNNSEKNAVEIISENRVDQEMIDIANLARADALHEFNFFLRNAIELYFSDIDNSFYVLEENLWKNASLDELVSDFSQKNLGSAFAGFVAQELVRNICNSQESGCDTDTPDYFIRVAGFDEVEVVRIIEDSIAQSNNGSVPFIQVIDCSLENCPKGTFYLNLDFGYPDPNVPNSGLSQEDYEKLPQIEVIKKSSCKPLQNPQAVFNYSPQNCIKVIHVPIVPRTQLRILVPLRVFKAIVEGKKIANQLFEDSTQLSQDLENVKLGVCDSETINVCCFVPNGDPFLRPYDWFSCNARHTVLSEQAVHAVDGQNIAGKACIFPLLGLTDNELGLLERILVTRVFLRSRINGPQDNYYNPSVIDSSPNARETLAGYAFYNLLNPAMNEIGEQFNNLPLQDFFLVENTLSSGITTFFYNHNIESFDFESRNIETQTGSLAGLGLNQNNLNLKSTCTKLTQVFAGIVFEEHNPVYGSFQSGGQNFRFLVKIINNDFPVFGQANGETNFGRTLECKNIIENNQVSCMADSLPVPSGCSILPPGVECR